MKSSKISVSAARLRSLLDEAEARLAVCTVLRPRGDNRVRLRQASAHLPDSRAVVSASIATNDDTPGSAYK